MKYNPKERRASSNKYKYSFNSKLYDVRMNSSFDEKIGVTRVNPQTPLPSLDKFKSNSSFTLEKVAQHSSLEPRRNSASSSKKNIKQFFLKLPQIHKPIAIEQKRQKIQKKLPAEYYQSKVFKSIKFKENTYFMNLSRQHFIQTIEAIKIGKQLKLEAPKQIKLPKKNPKHKTIFLDLDETLVHCDQESNNYTVKLNFPIEGGSTIAAGIRVRPFCHEFIKELAEFAEIIIFTASSASYADVVLNHLDPQKKYFSHRLYRQHCTVCKGFYTKDLRLVNRRPEDVVLVDNSAFCYMTQPEHGIPILPFYHYAKDKELASLLQFLKMLVKENDMRQKIRQTFFWSQYLKGDSDPRKVFLSEYGVQ